MQPSLASSRVLLQKLGRKSVPQPEEKAQQAAFLIIIAVCWSFVTRDNPEEYLVDLGKGYTLTIKWRHGRLRRVAITNLRIDGGSPIYWVEQQRRYSNGGKLSATSTAVISKDIADAWLIEVVEKLERELGEKPAADLGGQLKLHYCLEDAE